jgi:group II intron reverse transcriptase/maturase
MPKPRHKTSTLPSAMTIEEIANETNLMRAFLKVASNKGAPGPDRQSIDEVRKDLAMLLPKLRAELLQGSYRPGQIRRVWIPKPGGGQRGLGIPNVVDRVVQQAVHEVLGPHMDQGFHASSHGFRPGKSCHTAIAEAKGYVGAGYGWVVDIDLEKFFDRVHHERLLARLERKGVVDRRVLGLIRHMLKAKVVMPDGVVVSTDEGTPQGGPLSPLLSNVVLDELDEELQRRGHRFVRYADDCNIYVRSERAGLRVMASLSRFIEKRLRLRINRDKSAVARPKGRHFLGFCVFSARGEGRVGLSRRTKKRIDRRVVELTPRNWGGSLSGCIQRVNEYLEGWMGFFHIADAQGTLKTLDAHIRRRLRAIVFHQKKRRRHIVQWLRKRRVTKFQALRDVYGKHRSLWALSNTKSAQEAMSSYWFDRQKLKRLASLWKKRRRIVIAPTQLVLTSE